MKNIIKWLGKNNYKYELWTMSDGCKGICVSLGYFQEVGIEKYQENKNKLIKYLNRIHKDYEFRGNYEFILIKENFTDKVLEIIGKSAIATKGNLVLVDALMPNVYEVLEIVDRNYNKIDSFASVGIDYKHGRKKAIEIFNQTY